MRPVSIAFDFIESPRWSGVSSNDSLTLKIPPVVTWVPNIVLFLFDLYLDPSDLSLLLFLLLFSVFVLPLLLPVVLTFLTVVFTIVL